jgi:hypothetical protein
MHPRPPGRARTCTPLLCTARGYAPLGARALALARAGRSSSTTLSHGRSLRSLREGGGGRCGWR